MSQGFLDDAEAGALDTPAVVVDLDRMDARIASMARLMRERGIALRPHAKTHKSIEVARRQIAAGAVGLTVATIGEAEVFADAGFTDLFIAYPVMASGPKAGRLRELAGRCTLSVGADSAAGLEALAAAMRRSERLAARPHRGRLGRGADGRPAGRGRIARSSCHGPRPGGERGVHPRGPRLQGHGPAGGGRRGRGRRSGGRRGIAPRRRHRTDGPERGFDADGRALRAWRGHRGAARDVRLRRPTAGRPRRRTARGCGADGRDDRRQRRSRWRVRHRRRGQDPRPGRRAVHRRATARSSATPMRSSSGSTITTASWTCRRARLGRRSARSSGSCPITSVRSSTSWTRSSWHGTGERSTRGPSTRAAGTAEG